MSLYHLWLPNFANNHLSEEKNNEEIITSKTLKNIKKSSQSTRNKNHVMFFFLLTAIFIDFMKGLISCKCKLLNNVSVYRNTPFNYSDVFGIFFFFRI